MNNTIVLHKTVSESAAQYPSDHSSELEVARKARPIALRTCWVVNTPCPVEGKSSVYTFYDVLL